MASFTEDELVATIRKLLSGDAPGVRVGPGDDAALVEMRPHLVVLTTDMVVEDVDFVRGQMVPRDLGFKALTVNVSDVAAMAGSPRYALVALGLPEDADVRWVVELFGGMREAAEEYGMSLVGGDVSLARQVVIAVTVVGEVPETSAVLRDGARPGDRIVVTGTFGGAAGGLRLALTDPNRARSALTSGWGHDLLAAQFRPVARVGEGQTLSSAGATSMIDVSDGLAKDLSRVCVASGVGAVVEAAAVPVAKGLERLAEMVPGEPLLWALHGGEDFELLATLPAAAVEEAERLVFERFGTRLTDIGEITSGPGLRLRGEDGRERELEPRGFDHFG